MGRSSKKEYRKEGTGLAITGRTSNMEKPNICTNE